VTRYLVKTGNRDILGSDFRWIYDIDLIKREHPKNLMVLERIEWGNFYGYLDSVYENDENGKPKLVASDEKAWPAFIKRLHRTSEIREQILQLEKGEIGAINYKLERLRPETKALKDG